MNPLLELWVRVTSANPKFFKYIQYVAAAAALIIKVPDFLISAGVNIPAVLPSPYSNIISACAVVIALIAQLPNKDVVTTDTTTKVTETKTSVEPKITE